MRISRLASLLTGCAALALYAPAFAQDAPVMVDPPVNPPVNQQPGDTGVPGGEQVEPRPGLPPLIRPVDEAPPAETEPAPPPIPAIWAPVPVDAAGQSAYGLYLAGRLASIRGDRAAGSEFLTEAHALAPEQPVLGEEAFRSGLFSGDLGAVARLTPTVADTPQLAEVGRLIEVVETLRAGDARQSLALLNAGPFEIFGPAARYLTPAIAAAADDWETALKVVDAPPTDPSGLILHQQRAGLLESRRRFAEADAEYKILMAAPSGAAIYALDYAAFLERQGRRDEALAIYDAALTNGNLVSRAVTGRARVTGRGRAPAAPGLLQRASDALVFAALQTTFNENHEVSAIYLRLAESLHPDDMTVLRLGQSLAAGTPQPLLVQAAFSRVSQADPMVYAWAQVGLAMSLAAQGDDQRALEAFSRADAAAVNQAAFAYVLAAHLAGMGQNDEALAVLNRPTINVAAQPAQFRFLRGTVLENLNRIDEAEAELWAALQAQPNDPTILNYLGYMWVDSGRRVSEGAEMLARAHAAEPQNGNIQDSLGWAQFRQGQYEIAVQTLEEAVGKQPGNAEIVDHLGDAYWQVGRRREAEWQWSRVLTLEPDAPRRAEVEQKLVRGLAAPAPLPGGGQP